MGKIRLQLHTSVKKSRKYRQRIICLNAGTLCNGQKQLKNKNNHLCKSEERIKA